MLTYIRYVIRKLADNPFQQYLSGKDDNLLFREFTQSMINFSDNHYSEIIYYNDDWHESI